MLDQDLDQPATRRDLLALERATRHDLLTHEEAMRGDLRVHEEATRRDLHAHQEGTRRDLQEHKEATRGDLIALEVRVDQRFDQLAGRMEDLRRHFDMVAESFKTQFNNPFDWTRATTSTLGTRVDRLENDHNTRVGSVEFARDAARATAEATLSRRPTS